MQKVESQFTMIQRRGHRNLNQRFEIVKTLGQGTYGKVKLAVEKKTGRQYAIKSIRKKKIATKQDLGRIRREIEIMSTLGHPHIISVYEVVVFPQQYFMLTTLTLSFNYDDAQSTDYAAPMNLDSVRRLAL
ncbi:hypothetical protein NP493_320g01048 [Ridgeia piscesae]|uniref:Protein kinase domain-containing protein n=1 Tax=Ridgeia piscesae TaxID=27915 RepID=A0AAD9NVY0_RIDPI|nr:hypothetical protein NP493_320g01048 [Ridgeia piscesae]